MDESHKQKLFTRQFKVLSLASFLFFLSFNMIVPELPDYLTRLGGGDYKGLIIALFTLTAGLSRPFSGKLTDSIGRVPVMLVGVFATAFCCLLYPFFITVPLFFLLRFMHGFSTGFAPTGSTAYVGDIAPSHRRGEAIGLLSMFGTIGMSIGPALGSYIVSITHSFNAMFYSASIIGFASFAITYFLPETLPKTKKFSFTMLRVKKDDFFEPRVLRPAVVLMLLSFAFGALVTISPDMSKHLGQENKGVIFTVFTLSSMLSRLLAGRLSDRIGRIKTLKVGAFILTLSLVMFGFANNLFLFYTSGVVFGIGVGMNSPTVMAWTIDLSNNLYRGRALATVYIALEIGIGGGALLSGFIYNNNANNFIWAFLTCAFLTLLAFFAFFPQMKTKEHTSH